MNIANIPPSRCVCAEMGQKATAVHPSVFETYRMPRIYLDWNCINSLDGSIHQLTPFYRKFKQIWREHFPILCTFVCEPFFFTASTRRNQSRFCCVWPKVESGDALLYTLWPKLSVSKIISYVPHPSECIFLQTRLRRSLYFPILLHYVIWFGEVN